MVSRKKLVIAGIAVAIAILAFFTAVYFELASALSGLQPAVSINGNISIYGAVRSAGIATFNMSHYLTEFAQFYYQMYNVSTANVSLSIFQRDPQFRVYVVDPGISCYKCLDYGSMYSSMYADLGRLGLEANSTSVQSISLNNINSTAGNSVIVLATGLFPASLLPNTGLPEAPGASSANISSLLQRGDYIIYVGQNFSRAELNGQIYKMPNATIDALNQSGLYQTKAPAVNVISFGFSNPTFGFLGGSSYGTVNYTNSYNGTFMAFSNYPSYIWQNSSTEAEYLSEAISSRFWMQRLATGNYVINGTTNYTAGNATLLTTRLMLPFTQGAPRLLNSSYSLIQVNASNNSTFLNREFLFRVQYNANGTLEIPSQIGYGTYAPVQIEINEITSKKAFSINVVNRSLEYTYAFGLGAFNTTLPTLKYYTFGNLPTGRYYIASLIDITGRHYGYALFYVPELNVSYLYTNFQNGTFLFNVLSNGQELSNATFAASIDGQYNELGTVTAGVANYTLPKGAVIKYGGHQLTLHILNGFYNITEYYNAPPSIPPLYIEMGIAGIVILLMNLLLHAPNRDEYYIDVAEPPPSKQNEVDVTSDQIVNMFDTINMRRYWKYMPLTSEEIKLGISSNIRSNNIPVSVTLQNANEVLYELTSRGKLSNVGDYYLPARWEDASKHDAEYLVIFRKMRDYLVKNAAVFTDLDQGNGVDMVLIAKDHQVPLFIFSRKTGIREIKIPESSKAFMVFINSEAMYEFTDKLYNSYGDTSELLRMSIESGSINLVETGNLDPLLY